MTRLVLASLALVTVFAVPSLAAPTAYCTVESTWVSVAGHTVKTPAVTVPC
jgi:hypothetical protein